MPLSGRAAVILFLFEVHVCLFALSFFFFFSSRRRHTRSDRDWSSDVCSSDLLGCVPVVSRVRSGIPEVLTDGVNGYVVEPGDWDGIARRLEELHSSPALDRKSVV